MIARLVEPIILSIDTIGRAMGLPKSTDTASQVFLGIKKIVKNTHSRQLACPVSCFANHSFMRCAKKERNIHYFDNPPVPIEPAHTLAKGLRSVFVGSEIFRAQTLPQIGFATVLWAPALWKATLGTIHIFPLYFWRRGAFLLPRKNTSQSHAQTLF